MSLVSLACMEQASEQALMNNAVNTRFEGHTLLKGVANAMNDDYILVEYVVKFFVAAHPTF